jgi:signal transduction histidine kinase
MTDNFRGVPKQEAITLEVPVETPQESLDRLRLEVEELRESRRRLLLAADSERRKIERDLHDGVQQHLVALAMKLQLASEALDSDPSAARALVEEIARDVQDANDEAVRLAERIHPPRLDSASLPAALRSWAQTAGVRTTIEIQLSASAPPEVAEALYFCCLGALEHIGAGAHVTITVREDDEMLAFEVVDDGAGSVARVASRVGLTALRDRVEALGGHLTVHSGPQGGTRVSGSIPRSLRASRSLRDRRSRL